MNSLVRFFHRSFYHKDTGLFNGIQFLTSDESTVALNTPPDHIAIEGHHDCLSRRVDVDTGNVIPYQPPQPTEHHVWRNGIERWVLSDERQSALDAHKRALSTIANLETLQNRFMREHLLGSNPQALDRMKAIEDEIVELRKSVIQELCAS